MPKLHFAVSLLALSCTLVACANRLPASHLQSRVQYQGFSASRPPNDSWFMNRDEQTPTTLLFRREVIGAAHSFFFSVQLVALERTPTSDDDFAELVQAMSVAVTDPSRHEVVSYEATPTSRQGQSCVRYQLRSLDKKSPVAPGQVLRMNFEGLACRHPLWPNVVLDMSYSERGLAEKIDPSLRSEGEQLLQGVTIEVGPNTPAV
jgi:hypothetical protein